MIQAAEIHAAITKLYDVRSMLNISISHLENHTPPLAEAALGDVKRVIDMCVDKLDLSIDVIEYELKGLL